MAHSIDAALVAVKQTAKDKATKQKVLDPLLYEDLAISEAHRLAMACQCAWAQSGFPACVRLMEGPSSSSGLWKSVE